MKTEEEKAAVYCLAELNRDKGGGFLIKHSPEKISFIAEVCYPFWIAPFTERTLLLDGLNLISHTLNYTLIPDIQAFKDNLLLNSQSKQIYTAYLSNNLNYFQVSNNEQKRVIEGLVNDQEFIPEFINYVKEGAEYKTPMADCVLISPAHSVEEITSMLQNLEEFRLKLIFELKELKEVVKLLNTQTQQFLKNVQEEIDTINKQYQIKIQKIITDIEIQTITINKDYSSNVTEISAKFEQEALALQKDLLKLEKNFGQINSEIGQTEEKIRNASIDKDEIAVRKWKIQRNDLKEALSENNSKIKLLKEQIQEVEENRKNTLLELQQENEAKLKKARQVLIDVETSRDAEVRLFQSEMEKLEDLTSVIIKKIDQLIINREVKLSELEAIGIRKGITDISLVYMPFYLFSFQSGSKRRYTYLPPSIVSPISLGAKLKAVGKTKISQLFQPRSKKIISILNSFISILEENIVFNHEINEACNKANLLQLKDFPALFKNGLNELKSEGWLSESDYEYYIHLIS